MPTMDVVRWCLCVALGVPAGLLLVANWLGLIGTLRSGRRYSFALPVVAGLVGAAACLICPEGPVRSLAWLPLVLDLSIAIWPVVLVGHIVARLAGRASPLDPPPTS